jgi:xylulokinase
MSLLGIDLGTTGCKAGAFDLNGNCLAQAYREYDMLHPEPGWSELDSNEVWDKTRQVIAEVAAGTQRDPVTALAVSSFGEAFVPVTRDRELLDTTILCVDDRGAEHIDRLQAEYAEADFYRINPNLPGPQFSLPKLLWLREHRPAVFERADHFLLWSDLVAYMLGCEAVTNNSHANRTLLFDLDRNDWSDDLLAWSGLPREKLGRVVPGGTLLGTVAPDVASDLGLGAGVQVVAGGHDQCCNALGCGAVTAGKAVYGLGSFDCITPVFEKPADPLAMYAAGLNMEHHVLPGLYVAFLFNQAGLLVKWFRDTFASDLVVPADVNVFALLDREMPDDPTRLLVLPHFEPPLFPRHIPGTAGAIVGLKTDTTRGAILKAILEGCALFFVEGIDTMRQIGMPVETFIASGGGAKSDVGLQIRADVFGIPLVRPRVTEAGLLGAAMLAGIASGVFDSPRQAVDQFVQTDCVFDPRPDGHAFYNRKHEQYRHLFPSLKPILNGLTVMPA